MNNMKFISIILDSETKEEQIERAKIMLEKLTPFGEWLALEERTYRDIEKYKSCENGLKKVVAGKSTFATTILPIEDSGEKSFLM